MLADREAKAIIPAKIGVEQGEPANAKIIPNINGYKYIFVPLFFGICFIITGMSKSKIPISFKPIINISEAKIIPKYPPANVTKTFPVSAQITPITEKTTAVPSTKNNICTKVLAGEFLEYPPTYPIIKGSIDNEQGETDAIKPPRNDIANRTSKLLC